MATTKYTTTRGKARQNRRERQEYREFFASLPAEQQDEQVRITFQWLLTKLAQRLQAAEAARIVQQGDIVAGALAGGEL